MCIRDRYRLCKYIHTHTHRVGLARCTSQDTVKKDRYNRSPPYDEHAQISRHFCWKRMRTTFTADFTSTYVYALTQYMQNVYDWCNWHRRPDVKSNTCQLWISMSYFSNVGKYKDGSNKYIYAQMYLLLIQHRWLLITSLYMRIATRITS